MNLNPAYDKPSRVFAVHGEVILDGPNGIGVSMTPDAAAETAKRLARAAKEARAQAPYTGLNDDLP
jgi:hypothetical protein